MSLIISYLYSQKQVFFAWKSWTYSELSGAVKNRFLSLLEYKIFAKI